MKAVKHDLAGQTRYLAFTVEAMFQLDELFGNAQGLVDAIQAGGRDGFSAACRAAAILAEQGELARRSLGYDPEPIVGAEEIMASMAPSDMMALAEAGMGSYRAATDQHSPSKEFAKMGGYDVQGLIMGVEEYRAKLAAAYESLGALSMESYAEGVRKNWDKVTQVMAEFDAAVKSLRDFNTLKADVGDLEYQLWERTEGRWASDVDKYAKQLELLTQKQADQEEQVKAATAVYEAAVAQYGAGTAGSYEYQKALLEEKLAYEDLLDTIREVTNAKNEAFITQSRLAIQAEREAAGYVTPYEAAQRTGSRLILPDGREYSAAYQAEVQNMMTAQATHLPSSLEMPSASEGLVHHMEALGADMVNAISSAMSNGQNPIIVVKTMVPDGRVLAETTFNDLVDYGDANGTPILNPSNPWR